MTDKQVAFWLVAVLVIELAAVFVAMFCVFLRHNPPMHYLQKIGFALLVCGLVVQVVRSLHYIEFGEYPEDVYFPLWITKDLGACVLIFYYAFIYPKVCNAKT
jgi:hypothetical protein